MQWVGALVALALIGVVFIDAFEAMILPRRVAHRYRLSRMFYHTGWFAWRAVACQLPEKRWRPAFLGIFGPISLLALIALWAAGLIFGFALLHWSIGTPLTQPAGADDGFGTYLYFSGVTFFTLGYGDIVPAGRLARVVAVGEAGLGLGFLAVVISYLPVLYQAFSRREITISLLDARAGSPPTAGELIRRCAQGRSPAGAAPLLAEWERWSAELLEGTLSYPVLSFYRSQHDNQSWVGALTVILDTSALLIAGVDGPDGYQARLTFAMARHAAVDLAMTFGTPPLPPTPDRLSADALARLQDSLRGAGVAVRDGPEVARALAELRGLYEPFVSALAARFLFVLPPFQPAGTPVDNWQTSAWMRRSPGLGRLPAGAEDDHFD
jgi:hypothetical protein